MKRMIYMVFDVFVGEMGAFEWWKEEDAMHVQFPSENDAAHR